jgi:hypothetical protein
MAAETDPAHAAGIRESTEPVRQEGPGLATAALVGVGLAIVEPELIPGMLIGVGVTLAPKLVPALGGVLRPMVKGIVKAGYGAAVTVREAVAEAGENIEDIVAEARAEHHAGHHGHVEEPAGHTGAAPGARRRRPPQPQHA